MNQPALGLHHGLEMSRLSFEVGIQGFGVGISGLDFFGV